MNLCAAHTFHRKIIVFKQMSMRKERYYWLHTVIDFLSCSHVELRVKFLIACCTIQHNAYGNIEITRVCVSSLHYYLLIYIWICLVIKRSFITQTRRKSNWSWVKIYFWCRVEKRKPDSINLFFLLSATSTKRILYIN